MEETQFIVQKAFSLTIGGRFTLRPIDGQKDKRTKGQKDKRTIISSPGVFMAQSSGVLGVLSPFLQLLRVVCQRAYAPLSSSLN
jgi:hypothetical protein